MEYKVINAHDYGLDAAIKYFHQRWGTARNLAFWEDAIKNSGKGDVLPRFELLVSDDNEIIGCYALVVSHGTSRLDLFPNVCSLWIEPKHRGKALSVYMLDHAKYRAGRMGFPNVYLTTNHRGLFEKLGCERIENQFEPDGKPTGTFKL
ncbi:hypothetical protein [Vibrio phage CKB-S2]|nr:hypothetical protein [Vibrio phage CKB-S2]